MKALLLIVGIVIATAGGVITYRALYVEPKSAVVITDTGIRQIPNQARVVGGALLFVSGSALALFLYPHAITGLLSAGSRKVIKRNAALLPAYSIALALLASLGYMAFVSGVQSKPEYAPRLPGTGGFRSSRSGGM